MRKIELFDQRDREITVAEFLIDFRRPESIQDLENI